MKVKARRHWNSACRPPNSLKRLLCSMMPLLLLLIAYSFLFEFTISAEKGRKHHHQGVLHPFNGEHLSYNITLDQVKRLTNGDPVILKETVSSGKGRGTVVQDIHASPSIILEAIANLSNYHRVVPNVRSVDIYYEEHLENGLSKYGAEFRVSVGFLRFSYFLSLSKNLPFSTFYWTLDYNHTSDFDDNTGQWQVLQHPSKSEWSRVVYATDVKMYSWIPGFVITFLTNTALVESTTWVKREAEAVTSIYNEILPSLSHCFHSDEKGERYDGVCGTETLRNHLITVKNGQENTELPAVHDDADVKERESVAASNVEL